MTIVDKDGVFKENIVKYFAEDLYYIVGGLNKFSYVALQSLHYELLNI